MKKEYVPAIGLSYTFKDGQAVFDDGVSYTLREMLYLAERGAAGEDLKSVHGVKKAFDGELITECAVCDDEKTGRNIFIKRDPPAGQVCRETDCPLCGRKLHG